MKDWLKRIGIVLVALAAVCGTIYVANRVFGNNTPKELPIPSPEVDNSGEIKKEELPTDNVEDYKNVKGKVLTNLNFREEPSTDSKIIETIPGGTVVDVKSKLRNGWFKIGHNSKEGYVSGEFLTLLSEEELKQYTQVEKYDNTYAVNKEEDMLNIRKEANKGSELLTSVKSGSVLKVLAKMANGWYKVEGNAIIGYVNGDYIKILSAEEYNTYSTKDNNLINPEENLIATYTSKSSYNENSRLNMHIAADYMNGIIVKPGETYSHLNVVHSGNDDKYVESTIFVGDGKVGTGKGGGICQTSSTLYAAIVSAKEKGINTGLNVTAQAPHSGTVNYVPRKYEATVNSGTQDFCFRNMNDYSIKIVTKYEHNTLTVSIYKV